MTKVLTLQMDTVLLEKAEAQAAQLGLNLANYVRSLIEEDLASDGKKTTSGFASSDLEGMYEGGGKAATSHNARTSLRVSPDPFSAGKIFRPLGDRAGRQEDLLDRES